MRMCLCLCVRVRVRVHDRLFSCVCVYAPTRVFQITTTDAVYCSVLQRLAVVFQCVQSKPEVVRCNLPLFFRSFSFWLSILSSLSLLLSHCVSSPSFSFSFSPIPPHSLFSFLARTQEHHKNVESRTCLSAEGLSLFLFLSLSLSSFLSLFLFSFLSLFHSHTHSRFLSLCSMLRCVAVTMGWQWPACCVLCCRVM